MSARRKGTCPHWTRWSPEAIALIEAYQERHQIPYFSTAAEMLVRRGLEQSPTEILTPLIASAVRQAVHRELDRLIRIQIYTAFDAGMAHRFAAAAARDIGRLKQDPPERYQRLKATVRADTRRRIVRGEIGHLLDDLLNDGPPTEDEEDAHGDREGQLRADGTQDTASSETGRPLLHIS